MQPRAPNKIRVVAIVWVIIISLNALAAGFSFMVTPTGADIGISLSYLQYSPFDDYFIPGLLLFVTIGLFGLVTAFALIKKYRFYPQLLFLQGCILLGWIVIQMLLVRDANWLHVVCGISALAWIAMAVLFLKGKRKVLQLDERQPSQTNSRQKCKWKCFVSFCNACRHQIIFTYF